MEIILEAMKILSPLIATGMNIYIFLKVREMHELLCNVHLLCKSQIADSSLLNDKLNTRLSKISEQIDRSTLSLRKNLEPTEPIKPNNWDSIREAFKGPTRVEVNERN